MGESQNSQKYRLISRVLVEKGQILKDFQRQVLRKIGQFHGKFRGETADFAGFFLANFAKIDQFWVDMTSVV